MKITPLQIWNLSWFCAITAAAVLSGGPTAAGAADAVAIETVGLTKTRQAADAKSGEDEEKVLIEKVETNEPPGKGRREVPWLGVSTEETAEALASQLGLNAGEGLTVTYVASNGPAAKAGLQKNDVLVEFDKQLLVHPTQLRKLIQMHKEGDEVRITYYRSSKKETVTATIGKTARRFSLLGDEGSMPGELRQLQLELRDLPLRHQQLQILRHSLEEGERELGEATREQLKALRQTLEQAGIDKESISKEVKRSMEEVRKSLQQALRQATNAHRTFGPAAREFQELARRGLDVDKDATVVVKSQRNSVQSIVKTDDSGTYVVISDPRKQLTAHDKAGKLLFDGPIDTREEQANVPKDVWAKVKPMLEQLKEDRSDQPKPEQDGDGM
jgi:PDZ domain